MGSSGVLRYCGRHWHKLIISRRYGGDGLWGWTIMRKRPDDSDSLPIADYFVLPDGNIPSFDEDFLYPFRTATGKRYDGVHLNTGTVVKLYDYQIGSRFLSWRGSREALNENLVETILPFRLLDFRQVPATPEAREAAKKRGGDRALGIDARPFNGMEFLLLRSHQEVGLEDEEEDAVGQDQISVGGISHPELGTISIRAIALKRDLPAWLKHSNSRIFHCVNGQVHFKQTRGYLSSTCGLPALKDRVVVIVDASDLAFPVHSEVWKGDREHIAKTIIGELYKEEVTAVIKGSVALQELQHKIAQQELERATKAESNDLFQKLVDLDPSLASLLSNRNPTIRLPSAGGKDGSESGGGDFDGKYSPTFVRLEERYKQHGLELPINRTRPMAARTDVVNDYLNRVDNRGVILIDESIKKKFGIREHLHNGRLVIYLSPIEDQLEVGDKLIFKIGLQDDGMPGPVVTEDVSLFIVAEEKKAKSEKRRNRRKKGAGKGGAEPGKGESTPTHGLPKCILLTHDGREVDGYDVEVWPEDFTETDGGIIEDLGEDGALYKINYDNSYHIKYRSQQRGQVAKDVVTEKYVLGMRILLLGYEQALQSREGLSDSEIAEYVDDFRRMAAQGSASTVLALSENLPKIVDTSSVSIEDE